MISVVHRILDVPRPRAIKHRPSGPTRATRGVDFLKTLHGRLHPGCPSRQDRGCWRAPTPYRPARPAASAREACTASRTAPSASAALVAQRLPLRRRAARDLPVAEILISRTIRPLVGPASSSSDCFLPQPGRLLATAVLPIGRCWQRLIAEALPISVRHKKTFSDRTGRRCGATRGRRDQTALAGPSRNARWLHRGIPVEPASRQAPVAVLGRQPCQLRSTCRPRPADASPRPAPGDAAGMASAGAAGRGAPGALLAGASGRRHAGPSPARLLRHLVPCLARLVRHLVPTACAWADAAAAATEPGTSAWPDPARLPSFLLTASPTAAAAKVAGQRVPSRVQPIFQPNGPRLTSPSRTSHERLGSDVYGRGQPGTGKPGAVVAAWHPGRVHRPPVAAAGPALARVNADRRA